VESVRVAVDSRWSLKHLNNPASLADHDTQRCWSVTVQTKRETWASLNEVMTCQKPLLLRTFGSGTGHIFHCLPPAKQSPSPSFASPFHITTHNHPSISFDSEQTLHPIQRCYITNETQVHNGMCFLNIALIRLAGHPDWKLSNSSFLRLFLLYCLK
jgi:hypothetical protein